MFWICLFGLYDVSVLKSALFLLLFCLHGLTIVEVDTEVPCHLCSSWIDPFIITQWLHLSLVSFSLKIYLLEYKHSTAVPLPPLSLPSSSQMCLSCLWLSVCVSLGLRWISYREGRVGFYFYLFSPSIFYGII